MPASARFSAGNRILTRLKSAEYRRLRPSLEQVSLHENQLLCGKGDVVSHVYFPNDAVVSLLFDVDLRRTVEVAMEGNEAAVGLPIYLGGLNSCYLSVVRNAGTAMRLDVKALEACASQRGDLQYLLRRYVYAQVAQIAQLGVCNRFHNIDARLARWLLMTRDRTGSDEVQTTQASIANLLGVRRSSVTTATNGLRKQDIIGCRRGRIEILDRDRLRDACCGCYALMKRRYDSFLN